MKLLILTEGGAKMGFGHLTRTSAIAHSVRELATRSEIRLIANGDSRVTAYAKNINCRVMMDNWIKNWKKWEPFASRADAVLIDSYHVPLSVCKRIAAANPHCFWLDDYGRLA